MKGGSSYGDGQGECPTGYSYSFDCYCKVLVETVLLTRKMLRTNGISSSGNFLVRPATSWYVQLHRGIKGPSVLSLPTTVNI